MARLPIGISEKLGEGVLRAKIYSVAVLRYCSYAVLQCI